MSSRIFVIMAVILLSICFFGGTAQASHGDTHEIAAPNHVALSSEAERFPVSGTPYLRDYALEALTQFEVRSLTKQELLQSGRLMPSNRMGEHTAIPLEDETFWAWNFVTEEFYTVNASLEHTSAHAYFYVEDGSSVSQSDIEALADAFDNDIYEQMHKHFGTESNIDADNRVFFLLLDIIDGGGSTYTAGYFYSVDLMPDHPNSNQREMMYVDIDPGRPSSKFTTTVLAHEFQHLVHFNYDKDEEAWVNEGLSGLAVRMLGYDHPASHVNAFKDNPDTDLTAWDYDDSLKHYGASYLWMLYLSEQFPADAENPISKRLVAQEENGISGINSTLSAAGYSGQEFNTIFRNWAIANILNNRSVDSRWGYKDLDFRASRHTTNYVTSPITIGGGSQPSPVNEHANDYNAVRFLNPLLLKKTFRATFEGNEDGNYSFNAIKDNQVVPVTLKTVDGAVTGQANVAPGLFGSVNYVVSRGDDDASNGDYRIDVEPIENIVFVVDDTGSMSDEISSVKQTIIEKIDEFASEDTEYLYTLITFKDYVRNRGSTTDPNEIKGWIQSLSASGGGDCPEAGYQALQAAAASVKGGHVWIMTDASSHGTTVDALSTAYQLLASGLTLHSIVLGDCGGSSATTSGTSNDDYESSFEVLSAAATSASSAKYNEISRYTGGHYFRVSSSQISIVMEMVLNEMASDSYVHWVSLDGSSSSPYEVLIDAGTKKVGFLLNTYSSTSSLTVERPDGTIVQVDDPGVTFLSTYSSHYYLVNDPVPGVWKVYHDAVLEGQLSISADTAVELEYIGNSSVAYGQPSPLLAYLSGNVDSVTFALVDKGTGSVVPVELHDDGVHGDFESGDGIYGGIFNPNEIAIYNLKAFGRTDDDTEFVRTSPVEIRVVTLDAHISEPIFAEPGSTVVHTLTIINQGTVTEEFRLAAQSSFGWSDLSSIPGVLTLSPGEKFETSISVQLPDSAGLGDSDIVIVTATSTSNPLLVTTVSTATVADPSAPPTPTSSCPVDPSVGNLITSIEGKGMGNARRSIRNAKVVVSDASNLVSLYGQMAAKEYTGIRYVRFIYPDRSYVQVKPASDTGERGAISWWAADLDVTELAQRPFVKGRWFMNKGTRRMSLTRAFVLYPTHSTTEEYANVWATFTAPGNYVSSLPNYSESSINKLEIPEIQAPVDVVLQFAITELIPDVGIVEMTVNAGGVEEKVSLAEGVTRKHGMLKIVELTLKDVPAGTTEVMISLQATRDVNAAAALLGATAHYACDVP